MDFKNRVPNVAELGRLAQVKSYDKIRRIIAGDLIPSRIVALRIEAATHGVIRAWELLRLPAGPPPAKHLSTRKAS